MRHRIIGGATALIALAGLAGVVAAQSPADTPTNPFSGNPAAVAAGRNSFNGVCAACHGQDGAGTERGPNLGARLTHGDDDYEIFQTIQKGVNGTQMPSFATLPPEETWRLVTFIKNLQSGGPSAVPAGAPAAIPVAVQGDASSGQRLFFGKGECASCHEVSGQGSVLGPDLSAVGGAADLRNRVLHRPVAQARGGGGFGAAPFRLVDVKLKDGKTFSGALKLRDAVALHLQTKDGVYKLFTNDQVASVTPTAGPTPAQISARLSPAEVDDITAYLSRQRRRDFAQTIKADPPAVLPAARLVAAKAEPQNWPTYWGDYNGAHFSELTQITAANVGRLQAQWAAATPYERPIQGTPIVVDGVMYASGAPGDVYAIDARTGLQLWKFHRNQDKRNPYQINPSNRGVAVLGGRVFFNTLDNNLIALDARTGRQLWEKNTADTMISYTMTGAPLTVDDMVVVGMSGGEGGVRGFLEAYDAKTGEKRWRFETIPTPGQPGSETWGGDSWKTGGGATWLTGSYDPDLKLLYWTVGNPGPGFNPAQRTGDNLYTDSVVALDPKTGKLVWHYQFTPNDGHDWDSVQDVVLADRIIDGKPRKVLLHGDRNGFFYMLDRTNGKFISGNNFVYQTWNDGFDANGRPKVRPESVPNPQGIRVSPAVGGTNFQAPSYDRQTGIYYLFYQDAEAFTASALQAYEPGKAFSGRGEGARPPPSRETTQGFMAWDVAKAKAIWKFPLTRSSFGSGILATRGGVAFAASPEGWLLGLDAKTGKLLWRFNAGAAINASPMSYAIDGRQYVAVSAGAQVVSFALPQ